MGDVIYTKTAGHAKAVIERRADMATQCECLAMWDDSRECICDKAVEMPLSTDSLKRASHILSQIESVDADMKALDKKQGSTLLAHIGGGRQLETWADHTGRTQGVEITGRAVSIHLPKAIFLAALREQRADLMRQLQETGIVSVDSAKIRGVLK